MRVYKKIMDVIAGIEKVILSAVLVFVTVITFANVVVRKLSDSQFAWTCLLYTSAYQTVVVTAGGCTAKLGMNGKDHVKKGLPILEDMIGGFAVVVTRNDGVNPEINLDLLGRHCVGTLSLIQI